MSAKLLTDKQEQQAIKMYQSGKSARVTGEAFGVGEHVILRLLKRNSIEARKHTNTFRYKHDDTVFDVIDNEHAAYWLGFCYADATVYDNTVILCLSAADTNQVEKFRDFLKSDHRVFQTTRYEYNNETYRVNIRVKSYHLSGRLQEIGVIKDRPYFNRTKDAIKNKMERHFIRGYLDGDGCIRNRPSISFVGKKDILSWIIDTLHENVGSNKNIKIRRGEGIYRLDFSGKQTYKIVDWLYKDATVWMERKRDKINYW